VTPDEACGPRDQDTFHDGNSGAAVVW